MKVLLIIIASLQYATFTSANPLSRRDDYSCGWVGYQSGTDSFITTSDGGYPACSALCFSQSECKSFAWSDTECNLYDVRVADNYEFEGYSPYFFYDRECETAYRNCGTSGYQVTFDSYWWSDTMTLQTCASACMNDKGCKSYAFGNKECSLYAEPVSGNVEGSGSPYKFYDVACPQASSTTTTTMKTTTKTTSTTSKQSSPTVSKSTSKTTTTTTTKAATTIAKTTTVAPKTTTTTSPAVSPTGQICGPRGYITGTEFYYSNSLVIDGCKNLCAQFNCTSFAYGTGECHLYNVSVSSGFTTADDSFFQLYDSTCFNWTYVPPIDSSQVCGKPCFTDDPHVLQYWDTNYREPTQEAFNDCYQRCITYTDGYCAGWVWRPYECELWREKPMGDDLQGHPKRANYGWSRDCGPPVVGGASTTSALSTTASNTKTTSTKPVSTTTAKGMSSSTSIKVTTTASYKASSLSSGITSTTKVVTVTASTKPPSSQSSTTTSPARFSSSTISTRTSITTSTTATTTKSAIVTNSSTTKSSAQTTSKATSTTTVSTTTKSLTTTSSPASTSSSLVCGQQGYFSGSSGFDGYSTDYDQPTQQALSECYQYCVYSNEDNCAGWYWSPNTCVVYSYAPESDHFQASSDSGMYVWDRRCGRPVATNSASTTTTTTTTRTSVKISSTSSQRPSTTSSGKSTGIGR